MLMQNTPTHSTPTKKQPSSKQQTHSTPTKKQPSSTQQTHSTTASLLIMEQSPCNTNTTNASCNSKSNSMESSQQANMRKFTSHCTKDGRLFYLNHETKTSSWLPPIECWNFDDHGLPYGWECAFDNDGKPYYINHVNRTTTYEDPRKDIEEDPPPQPREVELFRDSQLGFGFVAGSEKPVIVRFVKEGGPSENKLLAGDQILRINGENVMKAPRDYVIELVKSCKHSVILTVCQPHSNNSTRKSALLTAAKKAKLKSNPSRVRFAEGVVINGSPLSCPSAFESCVPFIPNVLKVFLENGQTKTFKYDNSTTVQDVMNSLEEKLSIKCGEHYSLVCEHINPMRRNKLTLLDPKDTLARIAARPGAHNLRCLFRISFVPRDAYDLLQKDPISFEYLYEQSCNDVVQERFAPQLKYEIALRLAALHLHQHVMSSKSISNNSGKINLKFIQRECGLESFVPYSLLESMKRKELHKMLRHFIKQNQQLCPPGQKVLTVIQAKLNYLKIISELPSYGAKIFATNIKDSPIESAILISPRFGISHITSMRNSLPITLANIQDIASIKVTKDDDLCCHVEVHLRSLDQFNSSSSLDGSLSFSLEEREVEEFVLVLQGYYKLFSKYGTILNDKELQVTWDVTDSWWTDSAPNYCGMHNVQESSWSYANHDGDGLRQIDLAIPSPQYIPCDGNEGELQYYAIDNSASGIVDHNMNEQLNNDKNGIDLPSLVSMEILESHVCDEDVKQEDIIQRVNEMNQIVADAENYLDKEQAKQQTLEDDSIWEVNDHFKTTDSLLLVTKHNNNTTNIINANGKQNEKEATNEATNEEISPCESDSDSVMSPNESPMIRCKDLSYPQQDYSKAQTGLTLTNLCPTNMARNTNQKIPSFGLHSPDVLPNLIQAENELIETLKQMHDTNDVCLQFNQDSLYLESDIIDLTSIPPPDTPDNELIGSSITINSAERPPSPYKEEIDLSKFDHVDSAQVVAELDHLCDQLSDMQASNERTQIDENIQNYLPKDIDEFISNLTVPPPPPPMERSSSLNKTNSNEYLSALIIPPPPRLSPTSTLTQDDVIAKFWKATDDMKKFCCNEESSPKLFKRDVHSSSSGESGYDSVVTSSLSSYNSDYPVFVDGGSPKHSLPTVEEIENDQSESSTIINQSEKTKSESSSCEDLHQIKVEEYQMISSTIEITKPIANLSRSLSWSNLPKTKSCQTEFTSSTLRHPKPPIPPCSPSIKERRRQALALKSNGKCTQINGSSSPTIRNGNAITEQHHLNGFHQNSLQNQFGTDPSTKCYSNFDLLAKTNQTKEIFIESQRDIDGLLGRLDEAYDMRLRTNITYFDEIKYLDAKEALINESRQFVTSSKLFVKCATESSPQLVQHLIECVALLDRMFGVSELVIMQIESHAEITCLVDRLKEVAATYAYTVDTVYKLISSMCSPSSNPYMGLLMNHATSLATALSALMRTLRSMN